MFSAIRRFIFKNLYVINAFFLLTASIFLAVALLTYNYSDPSFNRVTYAEISNWAGYNGAYIADPMLQLFGFGALFLVVIPMGWALLLLYDGEIKFFILRIMCFPLSVLSLATFLSFIPVNEGWLFKSYGGVLGISIKDILCSFIDARITFFLAAISSLILFYFSFALSTQRWLMFLSACKIIVTKIQSIFSFIIKPISRMLGINKDNDLNDFDDDYIEEEKSTPKLEPRKSIKKEVKLKQLNIPLPKDSGIGYKLPASDLLNPVQCRKAKREQNSSYIKSSIEELSTVLGDFGVNGEIRGAYPGPVVTLFELEPAAGTKSSRVIGLSDDISRSMRAESARIAVIPGRNALGIEIPNKIRETVYFREVIESKEFNDGTQKLPLVLGKDIAGNTQVADLAKMPHLLIAGTTGSGKSVAINTMILSILYKLTPEQCKLILIDPKMLELSVYEDIPHLLTPVVTEPGKAIVALKWVVREMENRYRLMSNLSVRNIDGFNEKIELAIQKNETLDRLVQTGFDRENGKPVFERVPIAKEKLPYIIVVVDEMADLMLVAGKDIETSIQRLSQMARAAGIHIIMATQRPSVDVVTGIIKANFPTRVAFQVSSKIDSRTILGEQGAEQLLGMGDMLYMAGGGRISRVHGAFVSDAEVEKVVNYLRLQGSPNYIENILVDTESSDNSAFAVSEMGNEDDDIYCQAVAIVTQDRKASTSYIQRKLRIGYNKAASIIERMENEGIVGSANHVGKREILVPEN
jgi:DNA segregation ATPase FtsK/SpoIIIE, S-DNA-T family